MTLTPQNLKLLFLERLYCVSVPFYNFFWELRRRHSVTKIFSCSTATKPPLAIHSGVKSVMQKRARLIDSEVTAGIIEIRGEMQKTRAFVAGVSFLSFLHSSRAGGGGGGGQGFPSTLYYPPPPPTPPPPPSHTNTPSPLTPVVVSVFEVHG